MIENHFRLRVYLLVTALTVVGCSLFTRIFSPVHPDKTSKTTDLIAFRGVDGNIYTIDRQGENLIAITNDANLLPGPDETGRIYQYPTWAPNGTSLAFLGFSGSREVRSTARLYTAGPDGKSKVEAFQSQDYFPFYLYWSPDSEYVSFLSNSIGGQSLALHLAPANGGESRVLLTGQPFYWSWSSLAREMVIHTGGAAAFNESARLAIVRLNGDVQVDELDLRPTQFQAPSWSPSSKKFVLAAEREGGSESLLLVNNEGMVEKELVAIEGPVAFGWSPDGTRLAYSTNLSGDTGRSLRTLNVVEVDTNIEINLAQDRIVAFFWSPDGERIAYLTITSDQPGGAATIAQLNPEFRLTLKVVDIQRGTNQSVTSFSPTDDFLGILPFYDQYQLSGSFWSPDSQSFVFAGLDPQGQAGIYVVAVEGNEPPIKIADGELAFWSWN